MTSISDLLASDGADIRDGWIVQPGADPRGAEPVGPSDTQSDAGSVSDTADGMTVRAALPEKQAGRSRQFHSVLFERGEDRPAEKELAQPGFFVDLNLDQVVDAVTAGRQEYNLKPFFYAPLRDIDAILYRHEVMKDLERQETRECITVFAQRMRKMRDHLGQAAKLHWARQKQRWFLDAVAVYCDAVEQLVGALRSTELRSRGLIAFAEYLSAYINSEPFVSLRRDTNKSRQELSAVRYTMLIREGGSITVRKYEGQVDYSADVLATFARFKEREAQDYSSKFRSFPEMNHVEAGVLELVARLHSDVFGFLETYCSTHEGYLDPTIARFDREIQFYLAYLEYNEQFKRGGLSFSYPTISSDNKSVRADACFDPALAFKLLKENSPVVCNDFYLQGKERIFVVTGPNQGGKTTFARTFGILHYLGRLGLPVPGKAAQLFFFDELHAHFEREENIANLRGKLQDDLVRIRTILQGATPNSIVIMNEIFNSTTLEDAIFLSKEVLLRLMELDLLAVCVTFIDELASLGDQTVSVTSTVVAGNPALRTFKIVRRPADGLAYAMSIAEKYRLTYDSVRERVRP